MAKRSVCCSPASGPQSLTHSVLNSETDLDDVLQISNVFMNVSKGQVANSADLQKAFNKTDVNEIIKEVRVR